jgi:hypothetical protein
MMNGPVTTAFASSSSADSVRIVPPPTADVCDALGDDARVLTPDFFRDVGAVSAFSGEIGCK